MGTLTLPTAEPPLTDDFIEPHRENVLIYYLGDVVDWHGYVKFLSLAALRETSTDVSLEKLFVEPSVAREHLLPDALEVVMPEVTPLSTALAQNPRLILLGDPGSGKSTALNWICVSLSRGGESILAQQLGGPLVPVPFVLRELGLGQEFVEVRDRAKRWDQLLQLFLARPVASHLSQERYKHKRFEESILGRMLSSGQALLLLDGIDEIGSLEVRTALREAVIEGMRRYPRCRWMLTSRIVGYEDVRFDRAVLAAPSVADLPQPSLREDRDPILDTMERFYIAPFNDAQIQQFAALWWRVHERNPYLANVRPAEFLEAVKQTQGVRSLARIPHLLTMVALIYRSRAELPDGRALLYSFIADAYLGTLDKERRLEHLRPIPHSADEMRGWLAVVGWHLQRRRGVQVKPAQPSECLIDSVELLNLLTGVIQPKPGDDASGVATLFLDYVGRRSGLLMPRGKNELGHDLYAFIHLSFQEYFAALFLRDYVSDPDWRDLEAENANLGTSLTDLRVYASDPLWRETLIFLWESCSLVSPVLAQRLLERLFDWKRDEKLWGNFPVPDTSEPAPNDTAANWRTLRETVLLVASLAVNQHVTLSDAGRSALLERGWRWELLRQDWAGSIQNWNVLHENFVARTLLSRRVLVGAASKALTPVAKKQKANSLTLIGCSAFLDPAPLAEITTLQQLYLSNSSPTIDLSSISYLANLRFLFLDWYTQLADLSSLSRLSKLSGLVISHSSLLTDISAIGELKNLDFLQLSYSTSLTDLSPLAHLPNLLILDIRGCAALHDISPLGKIKTLMRLALDDCRMVDDLSPLFALTNLIELTITGSTGIQQNQIAALKSLLPKLQVIE